MGMRTVDEHGREGQGGLCLGVTVVGVSVYSRRVLKMFWIFGALFDAPVMYVRTGICVHE